MKSEIGERNYEVRDTIYFFEDIKAGSSVDSLSEVLKRSVSKLEEILKKVGADGTIGLKIEFEDLVKSDGKILTGKVITSGTAVRFK